MRPSHLAFVWLPVLAWILVILSLGGDSFSDPATSRFLGPLLAWLFPEAGPALLDAAHFAIRKSAHLVEYGVLGALSLRAWRESGVGPLARTVAASIAIVLVVAVLDEGRQTLSAARGGAVADGVIDLAGGGLGCAASRLLSRRRRVQAAGEF